MDADASVSLAERHRILALPPERRAAAILASADAAALIRSLGPQDFYLSLVEADPDDALALLAAARREQVDLVFDLDGWDGDEPAVERLGRWLGLLHQANPEQLVSWLLEADEPTVVLVLSRLIHVYKLDESSDPGFWPPEDREVPSLDGVYFLEPRDEAPEAAFPALWSAFALLRERARQAYEALLEQVLWVIPAEQQEEAWERREARLAERGFPPLEEALEVWAPGHLEQAGVRAAIRERLAALPRPAGAADAPPHDPPPLPAPLPPGEGALLAEGAGLLDERRRAAIAHALVRLGNRFAVASRDPLGDPETHAAGLRTALSMVLLALDELGAADAGAAARALANIPTFELCRIGVGAVRERVARAHRLASGWLARVPHGRARLEVDLDEILAGLLAPRPGLPESGALRPPRARADLERVDRALDVIEDLGRFVTGTLGLAGADRDLPELDPLPARRERPDECLWSEIALTALARRALGDPLRPAPLTREQGRAALAALLGDGAPPRRATPRLFELAREAGLGEAATRHLADRLEHDAGDLSPAALPDTRFVRALLFRLSG
ncbi:MAG: hypothetical protein D6738_00555 [Acidobacteria bacterium]|nr:MAG: hypothetical protein D6738_00555 [Acidobacteriota bacterium]